MMMHDVRVSACKTVGAEEFGLNYLGFTGFVRYAATHQNHRKQVQQLLHVVWPILLFMSAVACLFTVVSLVLSVHMCISN